MHVVPVCLHCGNIIWLPWQRPLINWIIRYRTEPSSAHKALSYGANIAKILPVYPEIFAKIRQFFGRVVPDVHKVSPVISGVTRQKFTKFLDDVAPSSPLLMRTARS